MGAGVALFDYDNDGDLDIYLIQGTGLGGNRKWLFAAPAGLETWQSAFSQYAG